MSNLHPLTILCVFVALVCGCFIAGAWVADGNSTADKLAITGGILIIPAFGAFIAVIHKFTEE